ncbi:collagen alpha-1(I) chain-like [Neofelis nebulosa]|uniref:collagen alpha-1(I) chain-like n=1 Tax=Neofelis nebulosa TaxID=61452 RepID=UPI002729ABBC|nr:collagen alpha-1(I) chain-like [Neofelis nebulosa]
MGKQRNIPGVPAASEPVQAPPPGPYLVRACAALRRGASCGGPPEAPSRRQARSSLPPPPGSSPGPWARGWHFWRREIPRGSGQDRGGLPRIPARGRERDSPAFALIWPRRGRGAPTGPAGSRGIVLRGCLAPGSEALDSCKILAGKLFDSLDDVLEPPGEARPRGPRARGAPAAGREGELWQRARGRPARGDRGRGLCAPIGSQGARGVPPRKQGGKWAWRGAREVTARRAAWLRPPTACSCRERTRPSSPPHPRLSSTKEVDAPVIPADGRGNRGSEEERDVGLGAHSPALWGAPQANVHCSQTGSQTCPS